MQKIDTICIVDDDPIHIFTTKQVLQKEAVCKHLISFPNGKDAYEVLSAAAQAGEPLPDLILLDLNMPIWDGWDFLDEFSKLSLPKNIPIYIVSSSNHPDDLQKATQYPIVSQFLLKPLTADKIRSWFSNTQ
ncbi:MAG TPA: response regulator [Microscillaceae bacterium]|jgi:CheY-like chemotaxis protein|nr:response regulator [Microscillaceae bacterium]